jgi:hypothetical protein
MRLMPFCSWVSSAARPPGVGAIVTATMNAVQISGTESPPPNASTENPSVAAYANVISADPPNREDAKWALEDGVEVPAGGFEDPDGGANYSMPNRRDQ